MSKNGGSCKKDRRKCQSCHVISTTDDKCTKCDVIQLNNMPGSTTSPGSANEDVDIADGAGVTRVRLASFESK